MHCHNKQAYAVSVGRQPIWPLHPCKDLINLPLFSLKYVSNRHLKSPTQLIKRFK